MKKPYTLIKFLFIVVAAFCFFSCSKKGNTSPGIGAITGKWNITADTSQTAGYPPYIIVGINSPYIQFNADGTGTQKDNISAPDDIAYFTYKISKDTIALNYTQPFIATPTGIIKKLTSKNLILEFSITDPTLSVTERVYMSR
jgi:hypothetical protein